MNGNWELDFHVFFWQIDRYYTCDMNMADSFILWVLLVLGKTKAKAGLRENH
jgi:hypothetical protein